jgi:hypothetical protein
MTALLAIVGGLCGLILGWVAAAAATIMIGSALGASEFEGALSMQAFFGAGPLGGLIGLALGIWLVVRWRRKRQTTPAAGN